MPQDEYEYDVAISFGKKDEPTANELFELLQGRLKVFLYSKEQEKLAGTDGEKTFNKVFGKEARLVVVLYREDWGQTPFTRFEQTAIRNRGYDEGYDFTTFIPMDETEARKVPPWLPKNRLYVGLQRWGIQGAAAAIESRVRDLGGDIRAETVGDFAARTERILAFKQKRRAHLTSTAGANAQNKAYEALKAEVLRLAAELRTSAPNIGLQEKTHGHPDIGLLVLSKRVTMSIRWRTQYVNSLTDADLEVVLWIGHPPWPGIATFQDPTRLATLRFNPDLLEDDTAGWRSSADPERPISSSVAAEEIMKFFLARIREY